MIIDGYEIDDLEEQERHDCNWCEYSGIAEKDGKFYSCAIQGDGHMWGKLVILEEIDPAEIKR